MATFEFPDGRWIELRPPSIGLRLLLEKIRRARKFDEATHLIPLFERIRPLTIGTSWGGDVQDLSGEEVGMLIPVWLGAPGDAAFPPVLAPRSPESTPGESSPAPTAVRRASRSRSSSRSSTSPDSAVSLPGPSTPMTPISVAGPS